MSKGSPRVELVLANLITTGSQRKAPPSPLSSQRALDARAHLLRVNDQAMGERSRQTGTDTLQPERRRLTFRVKDGSVALPYRRRQHGPYSGDSCFVGRSV